MTSKERVLATIRHEQPDRVPVGEWGIDHDHVSRILGRHSYWRNRRDQTLALWDGRRDEVVEGEKADYVELIEALDYEVVPVHLVPRKSDAAPNPPRRIDENAWENSSGSVYRYCAANDSIMCVTPAPAKERLTDADVEAFAERLLDIDDSQFELVDFIADRYADTRALVFRSLSPYAPLLSPFGGDSASSS